MPRDLRDLQGCYSDTDLGIADIKGKPKQATDGMYIVRMLRLTCVMPYGRGLSFQDRTFGRLPRVSSGHSTRVDLSGWVCLWSAGL